MNQGKVYCSTLLQILQHNIPKFLPQNIHIKSSRPPLPVRGLPEHIPADLPSIHGRRNGTGGAEAGLLRAVTAGDGTGAAS